MYDFSSLKEDREAAEIWLKGEYVQLQVGRITVAALDPVKVDAYGAKTPISQVASISVEDPKTLLVSPWDSSLLKDVETALREGLQNFSISVHETGVRVHAPDVIGEQREQLKKVVKEKLEEARKSLRISRDNFVKKMKKEEVSEDEKHRALEEMQEIIEEGNKAFANVAEKKIEELSVI